MRELRVLESDSRCGGPADSPVSMVRSQKDCADADALVVSLHVKLVTVLEVGHSEIVKRRQFVVQVEVEVHSKVVVVTFRLEDSNRVVVPQGNIIVDVLGDQVDASLCVVFA
jgi:hypothetical protein